MSPSLSTAAFQSCQERNPKPMTFRFQVDYYEFIDGHRCLMGSTVWARNAADAIVAAERQLHGTRGYLGIQSVDSTPDKVKRGGEPEVVATLAPDDYALVMATLAKQSGAQTAGDVVRFLSRDIGAELAAAQRHAAE